MTPPMAGADDNSAESGRTDEKNIFGEDRQQRAEIAEAGDHEV